MPAAWLIVPSIDLPWAARAAVKMSDADRVVVGRTQRVVRYAPVVMIEFTIE
jgi:hypothetical protein